MLYVLFLLITKYSGKKKTRHPSFWINVIVFIYISLLAYEKVNHNLLQAVVLLTLLMLLGNMI